MGSLHRILTVACLVPWLAVSAVMAREHVHESHSTDHASVAHRHFAPHTHSEHDIRHLDHLHLDHDSAEVSDVDEDVVWLDEVGLAETTRSFFPLLIVTVVPIEIAPDRLVHVAMVADQATLAHGPPRATLALRAPPSSLPLI